ncbi:hypothetical protein [Staphylococcus canis]|uniref:Phage protein n=1 Tax=Staphylococcus canis TaxID=2724942 RepID=A0ABS0TBQ3_9STAP|nr:hypothetical protein [Staphylococcus canis]MBI5975193.1 hypothetical protein [Staphylococcus canis]
MNQELLGGIYTLAGGVLLYSIKEVVRFFVDSNLQRKQINLEKIYPIYLECFKKAKMMIGAYIIPVDQKEFLDFFDADIYKELDKRSQKAYRDIVAFRQIINLSNRVKVMEDFKMDFRNEFSINQIFFRNSFVIETIDVVSEYEKDISYLKSIINKMEAKREYISTDSFITPEYQRKINEYNLYLDKFEEEFRRHFKVDRMTLKEKVKIWLSRKNINRFDNK